MIITALMGGLGNQMFQYAAGRRLAISHNTQLKLDLAFLAGANQLTNVTPRKYGLPMFGIQADIATLEETSNYRKPLNRARWKLFHNFEKSSYIQETQTQFIPEMLSVKDNTYIEGHWQSERYFEDAATTIRKEFQFVAPLIDTAHTIMHRIQSTDSVCIHVRRGDYVTNAAYNKMYGNTTMEYFDAGAALVRRTVKDPVFFVFTDDVEWCSGQFKSWSNVIVVEKELAETGAGTSDFLQLMSMCRHFIISNSTFGWWAAWLGNHPGKIVVAPANWYADKSINTNDICPRNWNRI